MNATMGDHRLSIAVSASLAALGTGVLGVVLDAPALGVVAGTSGVVAGAAGAALAGRASRAERRLAETSDDVARLHVELDAVAALLGDASGRLSDLRGESTFDPVSGLYDERYFAVLVQQQVAAARRSLRPVSVVVFEADGLDHATEAERREALATLGDVIRRTLRECDSACRIGEHMLGVVLDDTPEAGAVWAAERIRGTLLATPLGADLTISAGVACYPTHALGAVDLVRRAGDALDDARAAGADRVETAADEA